MAPSQENEPRYPHLVSIMSQQSSFAFKSSFAKSSYDDDTDELLIGKVIERLPRAPSIESDVTMKQRCFRAVYDRLRPKLIASGGDATADVLIAAMSKHFPLDTLTAEEEARRVVHKFRNAFGEVKYLRPLSFIDREGVNRTSEMRRNPRPANICHVGVEARINMGDFTDTMEGKSYSSEYFLPLRQSYDSTEDDDLLSSITSTTEVSTNILGNAADLDDILFSSTTEPPRKKQRGLWDSIRKAQTVRSPSTTTDTPLQGRNAHQAILNADTAHETPQDTSNNLEADLNDAQPANEPNDASNDSFDIKMHLNNPKAATLIMQSRAAGKQGKLVCTYHGTIGILDDQFSFRKEIPQWMDKYNLDIGPNGKRSEVNRESVRKHISQYCDAIQFRVFCAEFARAYVGSSEENEHATALAIASCGRKLDKIKMRFYDRNKQKMVTTTPDTVFKLMITHVGLLPENATDWPFCLPWIFFQALPENLQDEMRRDKYTLPKPAELVTKSQQLKKLMEGRDAARDCYDKLKDLKLTVDRAVFMNSEAIPSVRSHVSFAQNTSAGDAFYNRDEEHHNEINRDTIYPHNSHDHYQIASGNRYGGAQLS